MCRRRHPPTKHARMIHSPATATDEAIPTAPPGETSAPAPPSETGVETLPREGRARAPESVVTAERTGGAPIHTVMMQGQRGPAMPVRALWFVFVGWWLTAIVSVVAWLAMVSIVLLPLGVALINNIPTVLTLRQRTVEWTARQIGGTLVLAQRHLAQRPLPQRGLWFVFVGWWASALAMIVGYVLILTILGIPYGMRIYDRVPAVATLLRY